MKTKHILIMQQLKKGAKKNSRWDNWYKPFYSSTDDKCFCSTTESGHIFSILDSLAFLIQQQLLFFLHATLLDLSIFITFSIIEPKNALNH